MTRTKDERLMAACLRFGRRNRGLTGTNPSVGTLLVKNNQIIGKGVTAKGGRPHAEPIALQQAGNRADGATAYVSLEPCAHHGATPPCAQTLIDAGVARVVTAWIDPDPRVDGKGHFMLQESGIEIEAGILAKKAATDLAGYLIKKVKNRPKVIVKLAISLDGALGKIGQETSITGPIAKNYVHRMRAEYDAILVGRGTAQCDDPELNCRLPGLESRSPQRFILDTNASLSENSKLANSATAVGVSVVTTKPGLAKCLLNKGVRHFAADQTNGKIALPEFLEDLSAQGISTLMVEGGAETAKSFLEADLVDEIALFSSSVAVGEDAILSPITKSDMPPGFDLVRNLQLGNDQLDIFIKN